MTTTSRKNDVERFSRWSRTYEDSWLQKHFFNRVHEAVLTLAANGAEPEIILDVGCGTGRLLRAAGTRWPHAALIGVDAAEGMVEVARSLTPGATFYVAMAEALPLPDASVDLALSTTSFHHWSDQAAGIREVARVLRPGGRFFLADVAGPAWLSKLLHWSRFQSPAHVQTLFTEAGLRVILQKPVVSRFVLVTAASN
jgi:ubiquinone/menaquinone biosynthesis C-methylase UbiE